MTTLPTGSTFAGYVIDGVIARGGMGVVYRATQLQPHRQIALKLIAPEHVADEGYRDRFLREADLLASLEHCPSIVPVYASGEFDGQLYLAMRYMDGPDLGRRLEAEGPLSLARTVDILVPVAAALDAAHEGGLVHRDVKPANILFDSRGRVYLTDFGLTKKAASDSGLTRPGQAVGTVGYMAPEQFTGRPDPGLAPRIDIYALGCVLHACLTGTEPYPRDSYEQALFAHVYEPPPTVTAARPDLPPEVDEILARALAKDPLERYESAGDLVAALAAVAPKAGPFPPIVADAAATVVLGTDLVPPPPAERRRIDDAGSVPPATPVVAAAGLAAVTGPTTPPAPQTSPTPQAPPPVHGAATDPASTPPAGQQTVVATGGGGFGGGGGPGPVAGSGGTPPARSFLLPAIAGLAAVIGLAAIVLGSGVLSPPRATPSPVANTPTRSPAATATPTVRPTATPAPTATPVPTRTPIPGARFGSAADTDALIALIPVDIRAGCESTEMFTDFAIAKVVCDRGASLVWYELHPNLTAQRDDFDVAVSVDGIKPSSGDCKAGKPGESGWRYPDDPESRTRGRYVCNNQDSGYASMDITYEDSLVTLELFDTIGIKGLYDLWDTAALDPITP